MRCTDVLIKVKRMNELFFTAFSSMSKMKKIQMNLCKTKDQLNPGKAVKSRLHYEVPAYERKLKWELLSEQIPENL